MCPQLTNMYKTNGRGCKQRREDGLSLIYTIHMTGCVCVNQHNALIPQCPPWSIHEADALYVYIYSIHAPCTCVPNAICKLNVLQNSLVLQTRRNLQTWLVQETGFTLPWNTSTLSIPSSTSPIKKSQCCFCVTNQP